MPAILQCPACARRFRVEWTPGAAVNCLCGQRMSMRGPYEFLPRLDPFTVRPERAPQHVLRGESKGGPAPTPFDSDSALRAESSLRADGPSLAAPPRDPLLAAVADRRIDSLPMFCLRLQAEYLALDPGFDELLAPPLVKNVEPHEYQLRTVRHVLRSLQGRAVLADEVGLGKTIEAGLAIKELILRGLARRVLILTPASLATQWLEEMETKFGLTFSIVSAPEDWQEQRLAIASIDTAKSPKNFESLQAVPQDIVVVDEAHSLKNSKTLNWKLVNGIRKKYLFLLSATPIQNDLLELYNMVTLLRPGQLYTLGQFKQKFLEGGDKRKARDPGALRDLLKAVMVRNRRGEVDVKFTNREVVTLEVELSPAERGLYDTATAFVRSPEFATLYGEQSRLVALALLKQLGSSPVSFLDTALGRMKDRAGEDSVRPDPSTRPPNGGGLAQGDRGPRLPRVARHPYGGRIEGAAGESKGEAPPAPFDSDSPLRGESSLRADGRGIATPVPPALQRWFTELESAGRGIRSFSKTERLLAHLLADRNQDKMLVFTQYRKTQDHVVATLRAAGLPVVAFHGGMSREEKDISVEQFRGPARILVATESGGQGRNLQFCHCLVNYDLPWNPMRIEQRIGRVHRMGQKCDVRVINLIAKDTIEAKIYALLDRKIDLFRLIVGELDMILGRVKFEDEVLDRFLQSKDHAEFGRKMEALGTEMQALRQDYQQAKAYDEEVFKEFTQVSSAEPAPPPRVVPKRALKGF